jgi:hypothetical protein
VPGKEQVFGQIDVRRVAQQQSKRARHVEQRAGKQAGIAIEQPRVKIRSAHRAKASRQDAQASDDGQQTGAYAVATKAHGIEGKEKQRHRHVAQPKQPVVVAIDGL